MEMEDILPYAFPDYSKLLPSTDVEAYGSVEEHGVSGGMGGVETTADGITRQGPHIKGGIGQYTLPDGSTRTGAHVEGGVYKASRDTGYEIGGLDLSVNGGVGTGGAGIFSDTKHDKNGRIIEQTNSVGATANAVEGGINLSNEDGGVKFGLSQGGGAGGREHLADTDGDGDLETIGGGFDIGPVSFDIKSKMLGGIANHVMEGEFGDAVSDLGNIEGMPDLDDLTEAAKPQMPDIGLPSLPSLSDLNPFANDEPELPTGLMPIEEELPTGLMDTPGY